MVINLSVKNQTLIKECECSSVEMSQNYIECKFAFLTSDWDGTDRTAVFKNAKTGDPYEVMLENDTCTVPWEVLTTNGSVNISVYGTKGEEGYRITTTIVSFSVSKTLFGGVKGKQPSLTVYEQLLNRMHKKADNIQIDEDGFLQLMSGDCMVGSRIRLPSESTGGREVEIRNNGEAIQWRYTDSNEWIDLIALEELLGNNLDFKVREDGHLIVTIG